MPKYRFLQTLSAGVHDVREEIRDSSYSELKDFLEILQRVSGSVGEAASKHVRL